MTLLKSNVTVADVLAVDSLDTLYIMGLDKEFQEGRDWVAEIFNPEPEVFLLS